MKRKKPVMHACFSDGICAGGAFGRYYGVSQICFFNDRLEFPANNPSIPSVFLVRERLRRANRYGQVMEKSVTGIVPILDLAEQTGFNESAVKKDIIWLNSHGILRGCDLVLDGEPTIILDDVVSGETIFDTCECLGCLHTTKVRAGHVA